jgi:hypothetical protein
MNRFAPLGWTALGGGVLAVALFATGTLPGHVAEPARDVPATKSQGIALEPADRTRAGVQVAALQAASVTTQQHGYARGLDVGALAAIDAESQMAQATASASSAETARLQSLYAADQSASLRAVEAARAQAASDRIRIDVARRRVGLEYGPGLVLLGPGGVHGLVAQIARGNAALVRIDIPGVFLTAGQTVRVGDDQGASMVRILGSAAAADAKLQTAGALAIVRGPLARTMVTGRVSPASVAGGGAKSGVVVPRAAIVRWQGARWVYRQAGSRFERIELVGGEPTEAGWLVTEGLSVGDKIAVAGAGSLLAVERGGEAEDE